MNYTMDDGVLTIEGHVIATEIPVAEAVHCGNLVIARLKLLGRGIDRNVIAFDSDGSIKWRIQRSPHGGGVNPYSDIRLDESGTLIAGNVNGVDYAVDLLDGTVSVTDFRTFT